MEGRGRVYFCGVTMVLGKKGKGREGEELTPSLPPLMSPYVQQYGIPAKNRYIRSGVYKPAQQQVYKMEIECICMSQC